MKKIYVAHPQRGADGFPETIAANRAAADELLRNQVAIYEGREVLFFSPIHVFSYFPADGDQAEVLERCGELLLLCDELWVFGSGKPPRLPVRGGAGGGVRDAHPVSRYGPMKEALCREAKERNSVRCGEHLAPIITQGGKTIAAIRAVAERYAEEIATAQERGYSVAPDFGGGAAGYGGGVAKRVAELGRPGPLPGRDEGKEEVSAVAKIE